jgi:hypothetical protein
MVNKVYIVWCKLNKSTDKFDLGVFVDKNKAINTVENYQGTGKDAKRASYAVWWKEHKLS